MGDALKTHCPNCTHSNVDVAQRCSNCQTILRKRQRSHESDENEDDNVENYVNSNGIMHANINTTITNLDANNRSCNEPNLNIKQNNAALMENSSASLLPQTRTQTGPRMISTLFSTAAGTPVMVSEASLQRAKLKFGSNDEEAKIENGNKYVSNNKDNNLTENNNSNNNIDNDISKDLHYNNNTSCDNEANTHFHETHEPKNKNVTFFAKEFTLTTQSSLQEKCYSEGKERDEELLEEELEEHHRKKMSEHLEKQEETQDEMDDKRRSPCLSKMERETEKVTNYTSDVDVRNQQNETRMAKTSDDETRSKLPLPSSSSSSSTNPISAVNIIAPASSLLPSARIGLRPGTRRGFVPPQRIQESNTKPQESSEMGNTMTSIQAQVENEIPKILQEENVGNDKSKILSSTATAKVTSTSSSSSLLSSEPVPSVEAEHNRQEKRQLVQFTNSAIALRSTLANKSHVKLNKLSALCFNYNRYTSKATSDIPTIDTIVSGSFAFSTMLCSDAFRTLCKITATEVHITVKHWQYMLIVLGAPEACVPLDWCAQIVCSSMIKAREVALMARSCLNQHNLLTHQSTTTATTITSHEESLILTSSKEADISASTSTSTTTNTVNNYNTNNHNDNNNNSSCNSESTAPRSLTQPNLFFSPTTVALYVCEKYNTEIVEGKHSVLREIVESDVPSASLMILQLTEVCTDRSIPHTRVVRLSDGYYHLKANFDLPLSNLLREKVLTLGQKMAICGARLLLPQPASPLECLEKVTLAVNYNCVRAVSLHAPLGLCHTQPAPLSIHLVHPHGGMVSALRGMVIRTLPVFYISHEVSEWGKASEAAKNGIASEAAKNGMANSSHNKLLPSCIGSSNNNSSSNLPSIPSTMTMTKKTTHKVIRNAHAQQHHFQLLASELRRQSNLLNCREEDYDNNINNNIIDDASYNRTYSKTANNNGVVNVNSNTSTNVVADAMGISIPTKISCVRSIVIANDGVEALIQQWHDWDVSKLSLNELVNLCEGGSEYSDDGVAFTPNSNTSTKAIQKINNNESNSSSSGNSNNSSNECDDAPCEGSVIVIYALKPSKSQMACAPFAHAKLFYSARHLHFTQIERVASYQRPLINTFDQITSLKMGSAVDVVGLFVNTIQISHGTFVLLLLEKDTYCLLQVPLPEPHRILSFSLPSKVNVPVIICNATFVCYEDKIAGSDCARVFANEFTSLLSEQHCKVTYIRSALKEAAKLITQIENKPHKYKSRIACIMQSLLDIDSAKTKPDDNNSNTTNNNNNSDDSIAKHQLKTDWEVTCDEKDSSSSKKSICVNTGDRVSNINDYDNELETYTVTPLSRSIASPVAIADPSEESMWDELASNNTTAYNNNYSNSNSNNSLIAIQGNKFSPTSRVPYYMRSGKKEFDTERISSLGRNHSTSRTGVGVKLISREQELSISGVTLKTEESKIMIDERNLSHEPHLPCSVFHFYGNVTEFTYTYSIDDNNSNSNDNKGDANNLTRYIVQLLRGENVQVQHVLNNLPHTANGFETITNSTIISAGNTNNNNNNDDIKNALLEVTWQYGKDFTECKRAKLEHSELLHSLIESIMPLRKLCSLASDARQTNLALQRSEILLHWSRSKTQVVKTQGKNNENHSDEVHDEWWRLLCTSCVIDSDDNHELVKEAVRQHRLCWLTSEWRTAMQLLRQALRRVLFKFTVIESNNNANNNNNNITEKHDNDNIGEIREVYFISDHCNVCSLFSEGTNKLCNK